MNPAKALDFDDIFVGQEFQTASYLVTVESIKRFAAEFDPQPMHLEEQAAAVGPFGQLTASGWQTLALAMKLMAEAKPLGQTPLLGVGVDEIRFLAPVFAQTSVVVHARVIEKRPSSKPGRGFVKVHLNINDERSGKTFASETWTIMVPRRDEIVETE